MWLLNAHSLRLEWFADENAVQNEYAILSHTWEEEEVSFQDIQDLDTARRMKGFRKIELTCKQALDDDLRYAWVDTCCIDKKSSTELSEAINAMFNYYHRSEICYVFLADVRATLVAGEDPSTTSADIDSDDEPDLLADGFAQSRWFTRGWTLQELIAPTDVQFFSEEWRYLGSRRSLAPSLASITGIGPPALHDRRQLEQFSIAQRMSWAAGRKTTRIEDAAYSLFGIFGVNMPLLYGEGSKAFERLQQEIVKKSDDESIFLWDRYPFHPDETRILAPSPDKFVAAGKIIRFDKSWISPYELTNSGLRITLHERTDAKGTLLVFNCRYADDFRGPLALPFDVIDEGNGMSDNFTRCEISTPRQLRTLPMSDTRSLKTRSCFIVEDFVRTDDNLADFSIWIRTDTSFSTHFHVSEAIPHANWNAETGVMSWTYPNSTMDRDRSGYITWSGSRDFYLTLMFKIVFESSRTHCTLTLVCNGRQVSKDLCERWAHDMERKPPQKNTLYDHSSNFDDFHLASKFACVAYSGPGRLMCSAIRQERFDHDVCIVDLSVQDAYGMQLQSPEHPFTSSTITPRGNRNDPAPKPRNSGFFSTFSRRSRSRDF